METEQQPPAQEVAPEQEAPAKKNFLQLLQAWPLRRKLAAGAVVVISLALFAVLIIQARVAGQQLLYANLTETDAASVVAWLKTQRIPYTLKNGGRNIWIPADKIYETRLDLAANGLPTGGGVGFEIFDKQSFALTDYVQKVNYTRALQGELARTITSLKPVESTRVHLALPEKRLFKNQQKQATASVVVTLMPGMTLARRQVRGIINLVAGAVSGLDPANVKVIDSEGVVLNPGEEADKGNRLSVDMLTFQQNVENNLEMRAQSLLDETMGKDRAMVRVTATLDFAKVEKTEEQYNPDEQVVRSEQLSQESSGGQTSGGVPGVQSNLQGPTTSAATSTPVSTKSTRTTNYEISKTVSKIVNPVGSITHLSVSVLVADKEVKDPKTGKVTTTPRTSQELASIKSMVSTALGLIPQRGDQISVLSMPFSEHPVKEVKPAGFSAQSIYQLLPFIKMGLIFIGAVLLYFLLIRPLIKTMRGEVQEHYKTVEELEREQTTAPAPQEEAVEEKLTTDQQLTQLRRNVIINPTPTAFIIKNWLNEG